jgi:diguanylate cyclase (GGDEF)-like protein/PAS domain S-box-containing protein
MNIVNGVLGLFLGCLVTYIFMRYREKNLKRQFKLANNIFQLVEQSKDVIYYYQVKPVHKHLYTSPSVEHFLGKGSLALLYDDANTPYEMIHPDEVHIMEHKITNKLDYSKPIIQRLRAMDGTYHWFEEHATPIYENGELIAIQGVMRNIDEKVKLEEDLTYRINHDSLTNIYNRYYFEQQMDFYNEENHTLTMILCDLDNLKIINDEQGHLQGDRNIQRAANMLNECFSPYGFVARVGGDEFAIILPNTSETSVKGLLDKLKAILEKDDSVSSVPVKMSIGYASTEHSKHSMEELYMKADIKMYFEKKSKIASN